MRHQPAVRNDSLEVCRDSWTRKKERQAKSSGQHPRTTVNFIAVQRVMCVHLLSVKAAKRFFITIQLTNVCLLLALHSVYTLRVNRSALMVCVILLSQ